MNKKGFTLVELMAVIVIISIIALIEDNCFGISFFKIGGVAILIYPIASDNEIDIIERLYLMNDGSLRYAVCHRFLYNN